MPFSGAIRPPPQTTVFKMGEKRKISIAVQMYKKIRIFRE